MVSRMGQKVDYDGVGFWEVRGTYPANIDPSTPSPPPLWADAYFLEHFFNPLIPKSD